MVVLAGIDEAGLGPMLGPLTLGYAALRVEDASIDPWRALRVAVVQEVSAAEERLVVADSKHVFRRDLAGHQRLERTALAFLGAVEREDGTSGGPPATARELFERAPVRLRPRADDLGRHPWYAELEHDLPTWTTPQRLEQDRQALAQAFEAGRIQVCAGGLRVLCEGVLNDSFERTCSKAATVWEAVADLIEHLWRSFAEESLELVVDRQGGRFHYARLLSDCFPFEHLVVERESAALSEYSVEERRGSRRMKLVFRPKAEEGSFAVALASCLAKYTREIGMGAFNRYFSRLGPGLRPTAGYVTDARRWLEDAHEVLDQAGLSRELLVRSR